SSVGTATNDGTSRNEALGQMNEGQRQNWNEAWAYIIEEARKLKKAHEEGEPVLAPLFFCVSPRWALRGDEPKRQRHSLYSSCRRLIQVMVLQGGEIHQSRDLQ